MTRKRNTKQRDVIDSVIREAGRPLSVAEIHEKAGEKLPSLGVATVYRAINDFLTEGSIVQVELPGETIRYERGDLPHHHHFHCRLCDRVFDMHDCVGEVDKLAPKGFQVESHYILLNGVCDGCLKKG